MRHNDMEGDLSKLVQILKRILKNHPAGPELAKFLDQKAFNLNLCFVTFVPMAPEDLEELEEIYEAYLNEQEESLAPKKKMPKLEFKLSQNDVEFLKENGIRF